ncbi:hypothetical protein MIT9_P0623 [Methylomarinovum caldicuralii]|uniref:UspA domain-containing protein n=1 Tax=Methylomarinovum caldicuralii TaxID=438856 RepID=A0AAU9C1M6_9GAMM|nr:hypothetical protein [Methylomarinovum caldicuralii]BCX81045.1 hypothetical protein MIT9_P0623 [Methylomarinovum caldicuralii]
MNRIIVAIDLHCRQYRALEIGARLALIQRRELTVLLIESVDLQRAAELPWVREIDRLSASLQPFDPQRLRRWWQQRRQEIERWLSRHALPGQMRIETGRYPETALAWSRDSDLLVLATPASYAARTQPPVWVWYDGSEAGERALRLARELAAAEGCPLRVVAPPQQHPELPEPVTPVPPEQLADFLAGRECSAVVCPRSQPRAARLPQVARCPVLLV